MQWIDGIPVFGTPDPGALSQIKTCARTAEWVALMADHHKGYSVPIGGVVAYRDAVSPSGVGYDIGCGNKAVLTDMPGRILREHIKTIMNDVWNAIAFGVGRKNNEKVNHPLFESDAWKLDAIKDLKKLAEDQLGTVGSGNHYVDLFTDEEDRVWIGVHFGSRGLGHKTATYFLNAAGAKDGMDVEPCVLATDTAIGGEYLKAMQLAGSYAYAGRDWVCQKVANILGAKILDEVHNHHNYAWYENHPTSDGKDRYLWVVRKGATPAFPGQRGFVGGTMGEQSVILEGAYVIPEGTTHVQQRVSLFSTVHGAGRRMGRMEAAGKWRDSLRWLCRNRDCTFNAPKGGFFKDPDGVTPKCPLCNHKLRLENSPVCLRPGKVTQEMMDGWLKKANVELRGAGLDESPDCYKRLPEVLADMGDSVRILHTLTPVGVAMAGKNEYDPYKD
jgi:tRNA-splicing ligase RtcB (3'-phosphate/5'-hydroxy nucleic acid ligase)